MLLRLMSEGNEDAFAKIFRFYAPRLGEYVLSIIGNRETTEEIIQDVFMNVWRRRKRNAYCALAERLYEIL